MISKRCGACMQVKPADQFSVRRASPDGLNLKCRECNRQYLAQWRKKNPDAFKTWYAENAGKRSEYSKEWAQKNKAHRADYMAQWLNKNKPLVNAKIARRNAAKLRATPIWADREAIYAIYQQAAEMTSRTGIPHEVDHIYPLQSETVCGLHCEANLQILTQFDNIQKRNRMPEEWERMRAERKDEAVRY